MKTLAKSCVWQTEKETNFLLKNKKFEMMIEQQTSEESEMAVGL